jgi:ATP/ADP translocase
MQSIWRLSAEEKVPVALMFIYSFVQGVAFAYFYTAATAVFLVNFSRTMLPASYICSGVIVYGLSIIYSKLQPKISLAKGFNALLLFLLITVVLQMAAFILTGNKWVTFIFFVWIRIFVYVNGVVFWGIANKIFDLRQGKRLFGLISAGEVIAFIISFFSTPLLLKFMHTEDMFFFTLVALIVSQGLLFYINKKYGHLLGKGKSKAAVAKTGSSDISFWQNKYFKLVFVLAFLPIFGSLYVDFLFFAQSKIVYPEKDVLSSFLGVFFGVGSVIEFLVKAFLSGPMLSRYGLYLGLSILPMSMVGCFAVASFGGWVYGAGAFFFSFLSISRLFMRTFRTGITDPAFQVLFQPIPAEQRLEFQSKVEGGPKAFGNILAGVVIMAISAFSFFNLVHFSFFFLLVSFLWVRLALNMYKEYRSTLNQIIAGEAHAIAAQQQSQDLLPSKLAEQNEAAGFFSVFYFFLRTSPEKAEQWLLQQLRAPQTEQQWHWCVGIAGKMLSLKALPLLQTPAFPLSKQDLLHQRAIEQAKALKLPELAQLMDSKDFKIRAKAARLLGQSGRFKASFMLAVLLQDAHPIVRQVAQRACGKYPKPEVIFILVEQLSTKDLAYGAYQALKQMGEPVIPYLGQYLGKNDA